MIRNRAVSLALVGLLLLLTGCSSYRQIGIGEVADHDEVRVTFSGGERIVLSDVTVEGDSIHYWQEVEQPTKYAAVRVSSPLDQVVAVEAAGTGAGPIVIWGFIGALFAGMAMTCAKSDGWC